MQLSVNAGDDVTATAGQIGNDQRSPTMEHSRDFQPVQTHADAELKQLSARLTQVREKVDEVGKAIDAMEEYTTLRLSDYPSSFI